MKRSKAERSRKNSPKDKPHEPEKVDYDAETDFDQQWDEPLFSPLAIKFGLFLFFTAVVIGVGCPETASDYIGKVSQVFENSFHGVVISNFTALVKSSYWALFGSDDVTKPDRAARVVQPETYKDDDLQYDSDEFEDVGEEQLELEIKRKKSTEIKQNYPKDDITNEADFRIRHLLDSADRSFGKGLLREAIGMYESILKTHPNSPRAKNGRAECFFGIAEREHSNKILEQSINEFSSLVFTTEDVPDALMFKAGKRLAELHQFRGWRSKALATIDTLLSSNFPNNLELLKMAGIFCLENGADATAKKYFEKILQVDPKNHLALVHMGFIKNHLDKDCKGAISYFERGLKGTDPDVNHGRFYLTYGWCLYIEQRFKERYEVFKKGAEVGAFISQWQRSTYNCPGITSRAWWTKEQTGAKAFLEKLEANWMEIRDEALSIIDRDAGRFMLESEGLTHYGKWSEFFLYARGVRKDSNCQLVPRTCAILDQFKKDSSCTRGQIKFSLMNPNSHVYPHTGPSNCRLRAHLGLVVPQEGGTPVIRVGLPDSEFRLWEEGKFIIFDDSFEHEVWHNGTSFRLILIVDIWHPEVPDRDRRTMSPI